MTAIYCFSAQTKLRPTKPTCIYVNSPNVHCSHRHPAAIVFPFISLLLLHIVAIPWIMDGSTSAAIDLKNRLLQLPSRMLMLLY
jgi:hypothetical protein